MVRSKIGDLRAEVVKASREIKQEAADLRVKQVALTAELAAADKRWQARLEELGKLAAALTGTPAK
jgi:hypothetical protein